MTPSIEADKNLFVLNSKPLTVEISQQNTPVEVHETANALGLRIQRTRIILTPGVQVDFVTLEPKHLSSVIRSIVSSDGEDRLGVIFCAGDTILGPWINKDQGSIVELESQKPGLSNYYNVREEVRPNVLPGATTSDIPDIIPFRNIWTCDMGKLKIADNFIETSYRRVVKGYEWADAEDRQIPYFIAVPNRFRQPRGVVLVRNMDFVEDCPNLVYQLRDLGVGR